MGTSKSRATVLKYLETLSAKGVLEYRNVGRSKLWLLKRAPGKGAVIRHEVTSRPAGDMRRLAELASELHRLKTRERELLESVESPDRIVFTVDRSLNIVSYNASFETLFGDRKSLKELVRPSDTSRLDLILMTEEGASAEIGLMEKPGIITPYRLEFSGIEDHGNVIGSVAVGEALSSMKHSKRELEALLSIIRMAGSARDQPQLLGESMKNINDKLLPYRQGAVFIFDHGKPHVDYYTIEAWKDCPLPSYLDSFLDRCVKAKETISAVEGSFEIGALRSDLRDPSINAMFAVPIIGDEEATGVIWLVTASASISAVTLEDIEIIADEVSAGLKMLRLERIRAEYVNTLVAMNRISGIINGVRDDDGMLERSIASTMETLGFDMGCIYLEDDNEELSLRVHKNMPESLRNMCISGMFKDLFRTAFARQNLLYITEGSNEYDALDREIKASGVRTLLVLPIKSGDRVIGLLNMGSRQSRLYDRVSLENLGSIGMQLGTALERSKLAIRLKAHEG
jgi:transcriptional regulator with GAF, ATPase, and Fis domain